MNCRDTVHLSRSARPVRTRAFAGRVVMVLVCAAVLTGIATADVGLVPGATTRVKIAVVKSLDLPQYNSAYEGFISALTATGYEPVPSIVTLEGDDDAVAATVRAVSQSQPDLILALGSRAAREVSDYEKSIPIVYSMVLNSPGGTGSSELPDQGNLTGASLSIPLSVQLEYVNSIFPSARRIGIISNPERTKGMVERARRIAEGASLEVNVQWVSSESEIPAAVRALADSIDILWMMPDATVFTPRSSRYIIFELIKAGIPIMGLSSAYVKAGAVIALDCDYVDVGKQSGELAARILAGQSPATLDATSPRTFTLALNAKVRGHLRIGMDDNAIHSLKVVEF